METSVEQRRKDRDPGVGVRGHRRPVRNEHDAKEPCLSGYHLYGLPDEEMQIDYYFWVLRNDERCIVVDTGFDAATGARRGEDIGLQPG